MQETTIWEEPYEPAENPFRNPPPTSSNQKEMEDMEEDVDGSTVPDDMGDDDLSLEEDGSGSISPVENNPVVSTPGALIAIPPGYALVNLETHEVVERSLYALLLRGRRDPTPAPTSTGASSVSTSTVTTAPVLLAVRKKCVLGDINVTLVADPERLRPIEWVPNKSLTVYGRLYHQMESFLAFFNRQKRGHHLYQEDFDPYFEVLNQEVLDRYFPPPALASSGVPAVFDPGEELPQPGTEARRQMLMNRPVYGNGRTVQPNLVLPGVKAPDPTTQKFPVHRGSASQRRIVATITGKHVADPTAATFNGAIAKAARQAQR
jgi:hypothetical protein